MPRARRIYKDEQSVSIQDTWEAPRQVVGRVGGERELVEDALYRRRDGEELSDRRSARGCGLLIACGGCVRHGWAVSIAAFGGHWGSELGSISCCLRRGDQRRKRSPRRSALRTLRQARPCPKPLSDVTAVSASQRSSRAAIIIIF